MDGHTIKNNIAYLFYTNDSFPELTLLPTEHNGLPAEIRFVGNNYLLQLNLNLMAENNTFHEVPCVCGCGVVSINKIDGKYMIRCCDTACLFQMVANTKEDVEVAWLRRDGIVDNRAFGCPFCGNASKNTKAHTIKNGVAWRCNCGAGLNSENWDTLNSYLGNIGMLDHLNSNH